MRLKQSKKRNIGDVNSQNTYNYRRAGYDPINEEKEDLHDFGIRDYGIHTEFDPLTADDADSDFIDEEVDDDVMTLPRQNSLRHRVMYNSIMLNGYELEELNNLHTVFNKVFDMSQNMTMYVIGEFVEQYNKLMNTLTYLIVNGALNIPVEINAHFLRYYNALVNFVFRNDQDAVIFVRTVLAIRHDFNQINQVYQNILF